MLPDQQALARDGLVDLRIRCGDPLEPFDEVLPQLRGPLGQTVAQGHPDGGDCRGAGHRVAARGGGVDEGVGVLEGLPDLAVAHEGPHRHDSAAEALGHAQDVRNHVPVLEAPELAGAPQPGLHFVGDQQDPVAGAQLADPGPVVFRWDDGPGLALDRLGNEPGHVDPDGLTDVQLPLEGLGVPEGHVVDKPAVGLEGVTEVLLAHDAQGTQSFAVKGPHGRDEGVAAGVEAGDLEGPLDGLGSAVHEEGVVDVSRGDLGKKVGQGST